MAYALVENGKVITTELPRVGKLRDGRTVSNYHLLSPEVLIEEGWLPLVDNQPTASKGQVAAFIDYAVYEDRVEVMYELQDVPPPAKSSREIVENAKLKSQQLVLKSILKDGKISKKELIDIAAIFPEFETNVVYRTGDIVRYKRSLYEVLQDHTSQADWLPDSTPSLYKDHLPKGEIEDWRQPLGAHDAYQTGDRVSFNGVVYISGINNNVWTPGVYGWTVESSEEPAEYKEWTQPTGGHDAYAKDAIVIHNGKLWISTVGANVWEPGVYGWEIR